MNLINQEQIEKTVSQEKKSAEVFLDSVKKAEVKTSEDYERAGDAVQMLNGKLKELEDTRKEITRPLDQAKKRIMVLFCGPIDTYKEAINIIKGNMVVYYQKLEAEARKREQEQRLKAERERKRLEKEAKKEKDKGNLAEAQALQEEAILVEQMSGPVGISTPKVEGVSTRYVWDVEVKNVSVLPKEYILPDMAKLRRIAQASDGSAKVPGVVFKKRVIVAARRK